MAHHGEPMTPIQDSPDQYTWKEKNDQITKTYFSDLGHKCKPKAFKIKISWITYKPYNYMSNKNEVKEDETKRINF